MKKLIEPEGLKKCYMGHNGLDDKASYESIRRMIDIQPNALDLEPLWNLYGYWRFKMLRAFVE